MRRIAVLTYSSNRSHSMMNSTWPHSSLHDFETSTLSKDQVRRWNTHVLKYQMRMAMRRIIVAKHVHHALDCDAGTTCRDNNHRLLFVRIWVVRVCLSQDDVHLAGWIPCATNPPFLLMLVRSGSSFPNVITDLPIKYIVVTILHNA